MPFEKESSLRNLPEEEPQGKAAQETAEGKFNENYLSLRSQMGELTQEIEKCLRGDSEYGLTPLAIEFGDDGKLKKVKINGIEEGYGSLGKLLQKEAQDYDQKQQEKEKRGEIPKFGERGRPERNDEYIIEAYNNPQSPKHQAVKEIIDRWYDLIKQRRGVIEEIEKIGRQKEEAYSKAETMISFFGGDVDSKEAKLLQGFDLDEALKALNKIKQDRIEIVKPKIEPYIKKLEALLALVNDGVVDFIAEKQKGTEGTFRYGFDARIIAEKIIKLSAQLKFLSNWQQDYISDKARDVLYRIERASYFDVYGVGVRMDVY